MKFAIVHQSTQILLHPNMNNNIRAFIFLTFAPFLITLAAKLPAEMDRAAETVDEKLAAALIQSLEEMDFRIPAEELHRFQSELLSRKREYQPVIVNVFWPHHYPAR